MKNPEFPNPFLIDFDKLESYEIAALLFALLSAPPSVASDKEFNDYYFGLVSDFLHLKIHNDPEWAQISQNIKPYYLSISSDKAARIAVKSDKKIQNRLNAAHIAIQKLIEVAHPEKLNHINYDLSLNKMIENLDQFEGIKDLDNFETRVWRTSIPIIHLAVALAIIMNDASVNFGIRLDYNSFYEDKSLTKRLIDEAKKYAKDLQQTSLKIKAHQLIDIEIIEQRVKTE